MSVYALWSQCALYKRQLVGVIQNYTIARYTFGTGQRLTIQLTQDQ
jgi:hypothetical protein